MENKAIEFTTNQPFETFGIIVFIILVGIVGIIIGMYISSQIKEHIRSRINNKELIKNLDEEEKIK